ncbi:MAG: bifunctional diguanylate cyclase/phosphodiesterase [Steroidobacteraceae bacterium]|nr:bifunctional diguanylate cyclase/phosphodiesterase [Steroidobacteraceae bacterium]
MAEEKPATTAAAQPSRTDALLRRCGRELQCAAFALLSSTGTVRRLWARSRTAREFAVEQFEQIGETLVERVMRGRAFFASNRIRLAKDGPIVGRIVAFPVVAPQQRPAAIIAAIWRPADPPFKKNALGIVQAAAEEIARNKVPTRDAATGLPGWTGFYRRLERFVAAPEGERTLALLYGNIDRLHLLNDTRGMSAGDEAIVHAALVIRRAVAPVRHAVCRLSGDRFVVALPGQTIDSARACAEGIRAAFESEMQRHFKSGLTPTISWGVVEVALDPNTIDQALTDAELACRSAKDRGRNRVETFQATDVSMIRRHNDIDALRLLRAAVDSNQLLIYTQPIVPLLNLTLPTSYELLVRIASDSGRVVEPQEFMSAAARYQMLPVLDRAIVTTTFAVLRQALPGDTPLPFSFSMNLSATTLASAEFVDWLVAQLRQHAIPPHQVTVEITEATAASNLDHLCRYSQALARTGIRLALDDFGTGVNSLTHLKTLDIGMIKLDGSYIRDVVHDPRSQALVRAIVQLADSMGIVTVAEYVDSVALRVRLKELGVQFAQGFAIGRPMPLTELLQVFAATAAAPRCA